MTRKALAPPALNGGEHPRDPVAARQTADAARQTAPLAWPPWPKRNATSERLNRLDLAQSVFANNVLTDPRVGSIPPYRNMFNPRIIQLGVRVSF